MKPINKIVGRIRSIISEPYLDSNSKSPNVTEKIMKLMTQFEITAWYISDVKNY